jgi:dTMP kinase
MEKNQGLLIAFDGLDSTGKATQTRKLVDRLRYQGHTVRQFTTPDYTTASGQELKLRLQNKLGNWQETPWQDKLRYFARNRAEHREEVVAALAEKEIVVYDRYIPSSLAFITTEALSPQEIDLFRLDTYRAIEREEYEIQKMPKEDVSIFLDVPPLIADNLLDKRKTAGGHEDEYTDHMHVQERLYNEYDFMCRTQPKRFSRIKCLNDGQLLGVDDVSELIWQDLLIRFPELEKNPR